MKNLFKIGEIAELFHLNIKTLRYYDEIGLVKPEVVDRQSGYRYYSTRQCMRNRFYLGIFSCRWSRCV